MEWRWKEIAKGTFIVGLIFVVMGGFMNKLMLTLSGTVLLVFVREMTKNSR